MARGVTSEIRAGRLVVGWSVNAGAARIAAQRDGLLLDESGLAAASPSATQQLRKAIAAVASDAAVDSRRVQLARPSCRPPLVLTLFPIWRHDVEIAGTRAPRVAIFINEPDAPVAIDRLAVAEAFRLTRRESEVAALLAGGHDLRAIADQLGLDVGTVRNHLKRVYEKTGARSQTKLATLVRGFLGPST